MMASSDAFLCADDVQRRLAFLLAGRAAEEMLLGSPSSGAGGDSLSDLARATELAATAVGTLGFDTVAGLTWRGRADAATLPQLLAGSPDLVERVRTMLDEAYAEALALVRRHRATAEALTAALLARGVLDGGEAEELVRRCTRSGLS